MRRKDREIRDIEKIKQVIAASHCCRLGFYDPANSQVYIVPMNFGWCWEGDMPVFYFHSAFEGRKLDLIRANPSVGFELDTNYRLQPGTAPVECTAAFQSVIGNGRVQFVEAAEEKRFGLQALMRQAAGRENCEFPDELLRQVCVFKLIVESLSCKEHE